MAMTKDQQLEVALFRFGLIAPLLNHQVDDPKAYLESVASQVHDVPYYGRKEYRPKTIQGWLNSYRKHNLDGLKPQARRDKGSSRVITDELGKAVIAFRQQHPGLSVVLLYDLMVKQGVLLRSEVSYYSVYRFLKYRRLAKPQLEESPPVKDRKRFAYEEVNRLWQGDMMAGPYIQLDKKKKPSYLFAFIDDCSRLITFAQFSLEQNFEAMKQVFLEAVIRRGIPQMVYLDNGKVYRSHLFHAGCARLGTMVCHTEPFDAASKGKIERFFRTVRERFLPLLPYPITSLDDLNAAFWRWLEEDYHRNPHSALGMPPLDKYLSQASKLRVVHDPALIRQWFMKRERRRVNNDATISLMGDLFEVSPALIGQRVEVRFDPQDLNEVLVYAQEEFVGKARLVNAADNAIIRRSQNSRETPPLSFHEALVRREDT